MNATETNQEMTLSKTQHDLVRGEFSIKEAIEITNHLFTQKINFHKLRCFSRDIRFGLNDQNSHDRIKELKESRNLIQEQIIKAKESDRTVKISCRIKIEIV